MKYAFIEATSLHQAKKKAFWASSFSKCEGGYMAFMYRKSMLIWKNQK